ncbi:GNAT superfamily N-acetyltransferase [Natronocella acetinitrilica]|uniref:GNAT superfamily N-acetyltransferase n=1 Tax=Natronocella acetinitrilica TaxID=414046 RepID=A0AAE3G5F6_9GAMM|nr:GNAT family N-acetyltransferase [Natronocella acetinitrilica]MCP1675984.1 GNAT superfamily N-acetyltransferase [Natronocella acetinitrilica]
MSEFSTGPLRQDERESWGALFDGYAAFYKLTMTREIADRVWGWLHDPHHPLECLGVRTRDGSLIGIAHVRACPRPLGGCDVGFLDDMFVAPELRGSGAADALFDGLEALARERDWPAIRWITQHYNARGRAFYDRYTGGPSDFIMYQRQLA